MNRKTKRPFSRITADIEVVARQNDIQGNSHSNDDRVLIVNSNG